MTITHHPTLVKARLATVLAALFATVAIPSSAQLAVVVAGDRPTMSLGVSGASTRMYAADGRLITRLHGEIDRDPVDLEKVPQHVRDAFIAIEDRRFLRHNGIDPRGVARALVQNVRGSSIQGGSTITQQLAKNLLFLNQPRSVWRKAVEGLFTLGLERIASKDEILESYLNTTYFGRGVYGVQAAARSFFDKDVSDLTVDEGAFLAGVIHMPARYEAVPGTENEDTFISAITRRDRVLRIMSDLGLITERVSKRARSEILRLKPRPTQEWPHPYFVDAAMRELGVLGKRASSDDKFAFLGATPSERAESVYRGGLNIYTTLDPNVQDAAEKGIEAEIPAGTLSSLSTALVTLDVKTGHVKALLGGRDYYPADCDASPEDLPPICRHGKVNLALGNTAGGSGRQAGSGFKPFVLAAALEDGVSLKQTMPSDPYTYAFENAEPWKVSNYEGEGRGTLDITEATVHSVNAAYARLEVDVLGDGDALEGSRKVAELARKVGFPFSTPDELREICGEGYRRTAGCTPADDTPAIALGAKEVSPLHMAAAYATFANEGVYNAPTTISHITDHAGKVLYRAERKPRRAMARSTALGVTHILQQAVERGTGRRAALTRPVAGKTGTSQAWRDAWFTGYTPQLTTAIWVGNPVPVRTYSGGWVVQSMTPANGYGMRVVGGSYPARIWRAVMDPVTADAPVEAFPEAPKELWERDLKKVKGGVPSVVGMSRAGAQIALRRAGFSVSVQVGCPGGGSRGLSVFAQDPPGGSSAPEGGTVTIWSSRAVCGGRSAERAARPGRLDVRDGIG